MFKIIWRKIKNDKQHQKKRIYKYIGDWKKIRINVKIKGYTEFVGQMRLVLHRLIVTQMWKQYDIHLMPKSRKKLPQFSFCE
jgi:hypothetical protein